MLRNPCDINAACFNANGSYECTYRPGFEGDGESCTGNRLLVYCSCKPGGDMKDRVVRRDQQVRSTQFLSPHSISLLLPPTSAGRHSGLLVRLVILRNHISPDVAISRRAITLKNFDENANLASHFPPTWKINKIIQKILKEWNFLFLIRCRWVSGREHVWRKCWLCQHRRLFHMFLQKGIHWKWINL